MSVRNSAKAIVLHAGKILVNRCVSRFGDYYALPGGGQRDNETLMEAVRRELLEETGHSVLPLRLSGIYERLCENRDDGVCHKIYFVFLCKLADDTRSQPTEQDRFQVGMEWVDAEELKHRNLFPRAIRDNLDALIGFGETIFLGSERER
ncbi:MAG TPA: NUDIX domain-containing protein [Candidatus Pullichristensenella excrementigallinarum]|uniref:NUDIX domain-containing protein n=1 Tax=Candidatus Pullichristensenella excrementigallinarum TaxID=2840907 RepID=A0A9D1LBR2_9FIRM|nr:NUDIX domain-containing protein [Candidatus Pullichristensenella excrementigallinarum]